MFDYILHDGESLIIVKVKGNEQDRIMYCSKQCPYCELGIDGFEYCHLLLDENKRPIKVTAKEPCRPLASYKARHKESPMNFITNLINGFQNRQREAKIEMLEVQNNMLISQVEVLNKELARLKARNGVQVNFPVKVEDEV